MNILIVLAGIVDENILTIINKYSIDYIVAVDGGYNYLEKYNIKPNLYIGDMDSVKNKILADKIVKLNVKKDQTDYESALNYIDENILKVNRKYVLGFMSSKRLEHFYSNLMLLRPNMYYISDNTYIYILEPGKHYILTENIYEFKYVSFFAYEKVEGLILTNFKYEVEDYELKIHDNLCISNEIKSKEKGLVEFKKGKLLVFLSKDDN